MNAELEALARRAVACRKWRWMPGMLVTGAGWFDSARLCDVDPASGLPDLWEYRGYVSGPCAAGRLANPDQWAHEDAYPDLTDFATLGCLLALVREAWADQCACVFSIDYGPAGVMWQVRLTVNGRQVTARHYATEAEALVAALEVGP